MAKKKAKKSVKPVRGQIKEIEKEEYHGESGHITTVSLQEVGVQKWQGVRLQTRQVYPYERRHKPGIWLPKKLDIGRWLEWMVKFIAKVSPALWGQKIVTKEQLAREESQVDILRQQLREKEDELVFVRHQYASQELELSLARELIDNIGSYGTTLDAFAARVQESVKDDLRIEEEVKEILKTNRWILGLDCEVRAKNQDIDIRTEIDLHIVTNFGEQRIIEVKSPNFQLFDAKREGGRLTVRPEVAEGLSELVEYMRRTDVNSSLRTAGVYGIQKPVGRILVGYELNEHEREVLNDWNFYLGPYIKIITFKDLIESARKEIELIGAAKKDAALSTGARS